jgi:predicted MFS family arabinose efflux permease
MAHDLGVSEAAVGALVTVSSVTFAIVAPLAASLVMRGVLVGTMIALAAVTLACGLGAASSGVFGFGGLAMAGLVVSGAGLIGLLKAGSAEV